MNSRLVTVILAAGLGKRMKSGIAKVLHPVAGVPMILYPVRCAEELSSEKIIVVVGHQADRVQEVLSGRKVGIVNQPAQKGTADAVRLAINDLSGYEGMIVILCGDIPLITSKTISSLVSAHKQASAAATVLTAEVEDPSGYGRIVRAEDGSILRITEDRDADDRVRKIREINTGIYVFDSRFLSDILHEIRSENVQREFYLTDSVEIAHKRGLRVSTFKALDSEETAGINSRADLSVADMNMRKRINYQHMINGVTLINPGSIYIDSGVSIERDVTIYPGSTISGSSTIGEGCIIMPYSRITDSHIGKRTEIKDFCLIEESRIGDDCEIGPYARMRPGSILGNSVRIGNFVELKKVVMADKSKANHLTYLGDAEIGSGVNIGAGTITCNYDGEKKHKTIVGDRVFVGSDVQFVAPVRIGDDAFIAAGSTVTKDVPEGALAISRVEQRNMEEWVKQRKKRKSPKQ